MTAAEAPLPEGFGLELDRSVRTFAQGTVLVGGHPGRLVTLSPHGVDALAALRSGRPVTLGARQLGARLVRAGLAHPHARTGPAGPAASRATVTVVVPVRDRADELDRCLASLAPGPPVVVVDDGSDDPAPVAEVSRRHGARLIRREVSGGPGVARNHALGAVDTDLVAFVDSDCLAPGDWLAGLVPLFDDPDIGAVAPRIRPHLSGGVVPVTALDRYAGARSALDLGPEAGEVGPDRAVRYVPTAAMVARRSALHQGFDPALRVGEDVDLVWRLVAGGWRVRYEPSVTVHHREPRSWRRLLARRFRYGTSAGPLARRHPGALAPVELRAWPTTVAVGALAGRPVTALAALAALAGSTASLHRDLRGHAIPVTQSLRWSAAGAGWTLVGLARASTMLAGPLLLTAAWRGRRARVTAATLVLLPAAVDWWRRRPPLDPLRWALASVADDVAYGCGVWAGCLSARTAGPLIPSFRRRTGPVAVITGTGATVGK